MRGIQNVLMGFALALVIVGCGKGNGARQADADVQGEQEFSLARIYFRLPELYDLPTTNEAQKIIAEQKRHARLRDVFRQLRETAGIVDYTKAAKSNTNELRLVTVKGKTLTRAESLQLVTLHLKLAKIKDRKQNQASLKRLSAKLSKTAVAHFVQCELWGAYARDNGVSLSAAQIASNQNKFAKSCGMPNYSALCTKLSLFERQLLSEEMERNLLMEEGRKHALANIGNVVSPEEIASAFARFEHVRAVSAATNALVWAKASNIWHRVEARELTFEEAAADYTEDDESESDGSWMNVRLADLGNEPQLALFLKTAKRNDMSAPLEADNGLCLVKVRKISKVRVKGEGKEP